MALVLPLSTGIAPRWGGKSMWEVSRERGRGRQRVMQEGSCSVLWRYEGVLKEFGILTWTGECLRLWVCVRGRVSGCRLLLSSAGGRHGSWLSSGRAWIGRLLGQCWVSSIASICSASRPGPGEFWATGPGSSARREINSLYELFLIIFFLWLFPR